MGIRSRRERAKKEGKSTGDVEGNFIAACDAPLQRLQTKVVYFNATWKMMLANFAMLIFARSAYVVMRTFTSNASAVAGDIALFHCLTFILCITCRRLLQDPPVDILVNGRTATAALCLLMQIAIRIFAESSKGGAVSPMIDAAYFVVVIATLLYTRSSSRLVAQTRSKILGESAKSK